MGVKNKISKINLLASNFVIKNIKSYFLYSIVSPFYHNEKKSVYKGMQKYFLNLKKRKNAQYCLRRNLHRLEKGLTHSNPKESFGDKYISETVDAYEIEYRRNSNDETVIWANTVLKNYFENVDTTEEIIKKCKFRFYKIRGNKELLNEIKYQRRSENKTHANLNPEQAKIFLESRKSIRWFEKKKVDRNILHKVAQLAKSAPSACNRQPIKIFVYDDPSTIEKISSLPIGASTFYKNVPVFILFIGSLDAYFSERDRHTIYVDGGLIAMNFMLALEAYGLSSCPINWPEINSKNKKLSKIVRLKPYEKCVMCLAVGYAKNDQIIPLSIRKKTEDLLVYNQFKKN
ncbi:MAG: nitroreductase family protein [Bacteroidota bacterium]